jgi:hypothetical protein
MRWVDSIEGVCNPVGGPPQADPDSGRHHENFIRRRVKSFNPTAHLMKRQIFTLVFLFAVQLLKAQLRDTFFVATAEIKLFLNESQLPTASNIQLSDKPYVIPVGKFLEHVLQDDTLFSKEDIDFIKKQIKQRNNSLWNSKLIDSVTFIKAAEIDSIFKNFKVDSGWKIFYKTYGSDFFRMSFPYFSLDRQTSIIYIGHQCGDLCGEGTLRIYRRTKNAWKLYRKILLWAS